jgi:hypothetical protein
LEQQTKAGSSDESSLGKWEKEKEVVMDRVDDFTFTATVGPAQEVGEMSITIIRHRHGREPEPVDHGGQSLHLYRLTSLYQEIKSL